MATAARTKKRTPAQNGLPLLYFVLALVLTVVTLPTVLRPPQVPPTQTAELSPDAPPDDEQQSIISTLNRASSGTAGTGEGTGEGDGPVDRMTVATVKAVARGCPFGVGNPPRQTFSYFSAPCAPTFTGDNGGATAKGVTATEVRVAIGDPNGDHGTEGPVPDTPRQNENTADRTYRAMQQFFNSRYQFWGRRLQLIVINGHDGSDNAKQRAAAVKADSYGVFAANMGRFATMDELARRGVIGFAEQGDYYSGSWMAENRPYMWGTRGDGTLLMRMAAEFACKSLWGRNARWAGDPTFQTSPRKFGIVFNDNLGYRRTDPEFRAAFSEGCGGVVAKSIALPGDGSTSLDPSVIGSAATQLRSEGVTTIIDATNVADSAALTATFTAQGYYPEWIVTGMGLKDANFDASLQNEEQWRHAFGIAFTTIDDSQGLPGGDMSHEVSYRAYKEVEPATSPDNVMLIRLFAQLEQIANGIQMAGPILTPETFEKGLFAMGQLTRDVPGWEVVGGFKPGDYTFADKAAIIWWDPDAVSSTNTSGAYRWVDRGRRYGLGELPTGEHPGLFVDGITTRAEAP